MPPSLATLPAFERDSHDVTAIVETPRGHRSKLKYDPERRLFTLHRLLPEGMVFPYDFGFIPSTHAEDGDPLDVLILVDEAQFPGCVVPARLVGVIEAEQTEPEGEVVRNDRLIAVATSSIRYRDVHELSDLPAEMMEQIETFFGMSAEASGKHFFPRGRKGARRAQTLLDDARRHAKRARRRSGAGRSKAG